MRSSDVELVGEKPAVMEEKPTVVGGKPAILANGRNSSRVSSLAGEVSKKNLNVEEDKDDNPVLSVDNLTQWLIYFSSSAANLLKKKSHFYRDEYNVLRDTQWRALRGSENPLIAAANIENVHNFASMKQEMSFNEIQAVLDKTGCIMLPVVLFNNGNSRNIRHYEESSQQRSEFRSLPISEEDFESPGVFRRHCLFLSDWQKLWNYLRHDEQDEVALHAPYFRTCVEFFFHRRTVQLMYFLIGWNLGVFILAQVVYPNISSKYVVNFRCAFQIFQLAVYLTACLMNKGTLPKFFEINPLRRSKKKADREVSYNIDVDERVPIHGYTFHVHWGATARQLSRKTCSELYNFFQTVKEESEASRNFSRRGMYYYKWMNMMLKVLTRLNGIEMEKTNFNRQIYRFVLIFSTIAYPIYCLFIVWESYVSILVSSCRDSAHNSTCNSSFIIMTATLGFFTIWLQHFIYGASILISLSGLAYGGEITYRLADAWLQKYGCLRRVDDVDSCYIDRDAINRASGGKTDNDKQSKYKESAGKNFHIVNGFQFSSESFSKEASATKKGENEEPSQEIANMISRDATEQYLFIREAMNTAGRIWSPVITGLLFLAAFVATIQIYTVVYDAQRNYANIWVFLRLTLYVVVRILVFVIYPVVSIASANAFLFKISETFTVSAEDDYVVIGGRDRWIEFTEKFPAVWTYYGIYVTPERLAGIMWTSFIAFLSVTFSALANTTM